MRFTTCVCYNQESNRFKRLELLLSKRLFSFLLDGVHCNQVVYNRIWLYQISNIWLYAMLKWTSHRDFFHCEPPILKLQLQAKEQ